MSKPDSADAEGLSVVIPAYNEEHGIAQVIRSLLSILSECRFDSEIIVVNDGSSDGTDKALAEFSGRITVHNHSLNRGYGASIKTGIRNSRFDTICITDADGTYPNERIPELFSLYHEKNCDMLVGGRTGEKVSIPLIRKPAKWVIGQLANFVVGARIPDINSGLRLFNRLTALRMFSILPDGFSLTTTITLGMMTNGHRVEYVPINYHHRVGRSKIRPIHDTLNFIQLILRMALYFAPLKIFVPLSVFLGALGIFWGVFSWIVLGKLADVSTLILIMTAVQLGAIGMLAELIHWRMPSLYRRGDRRSEEGFQEQDE
ncbi:MAG: glycosyltransferase family 2 protein [Rhodospirillales bacterium]|nr:glycosyltransferase family 2 protein [Rhodospirillales bacterium]